MIRQIVYLCLILVAVVLLQVGVDEGWFVDLGTVEAVAELESERPRVAREDWQAVSQWIDWSMKQQLRDYYYNEKEGEINAMLGSE